MNGKVEVIRKGFAEMKRKEKKEEKQYLSHHNRILSAHLSSV